MSITSFTAYKDSSGKLFTTLEEVQTAERRGRYLATFEKAKAKQPDLARLDPRLVVDFLMSHGPMIGLTANDRLEPAFEKLTPATPAGKLNPESSLTDKADGRFENLPRFPGGGLVGDRPVSKLPELAMGYGADTTGRPALAVKEAEAKAILTGSHRDENLYAIVADGLGREFPGNEDLYAEGDLRRLVSDSVATARAEGMEPKSNIARPGRD